MAHRVEETAIELQMEALGGRSIFTLSGGEKQRLAVAVSVMCDKEILVFDELTSGLDYEGMVQVAALMEALAKKGHIVFVVTHDYELLCQSCTWVLQLAEGSVKADIPISLENLEKVRGLLT